MPGVKVVKMLAQFRDRAFSCALVVGRLLGRKS